MFVAENRTADGAAGAAPVRQLASAHGLACGGRGEPLQHQAGRGISLWEEGERQGIILYQPDPPAIL